MVALPYCDCFSAWGTPDEWTEPEFHTDEQDESCEAWQKLLAYIESIRRNGGEIFVPADAVGSGYYDIVTLPKEIATLKTVKEICLYRSGISWLPPEIGEMESLEYFDVYTSYRLHWYPYEITRCKKLVNSRMSTRTLYGNFKIKPPFPKLDGNPMRLFGPRPRCSICGKMSAYDDCRQYWISKRVATDRMPLLATVCSDACLDELKVPDRYDEWPHRGGLKPGRR